MLADVFTVQGRLGLKMGLHTPPNVERATPADG